MGSMTIEVCAATTPKFIVIPSVAGSADELESVVDVAAGAERGERRQQVPTGQVPRRAEHHQPRDHDVTPSRASVTPLEITPIWLKACGKLPLNSPVVGAICSGSSPSALARAHNDA